MTASSRAGLTRSMEAATGLQRADRRVSAGDHSAACLKMLNDIRIEDRLRTDASSLDGMIGELRLSFLLCGQSCKLCDQSTSELYGLSGFGGC